MKTLNKIVKMLIATMIAFQLPVSVSAEEKVTYETILGDALNYGIIANEYNQANHTQTNFATKRYSANGNVVEVNISGEGSVPVVVGELDSVLRFGGATAGNKEMTYKVTTSDMYQSEENSRFLSDNKDLGHLQMNYKQNSEVNSIVDSYLSRIDSSSNNLYAKESTMIMSDDMVTDINHFDLDLRSYGDETVVISVPAGAEKFKQILRTTDALNIIKNEATTVVFNVEDTNVYVGKYHVTVNDNDIHTDTDVTESQHNVDVDNQIIRKIYWNLHNASQVELNVTAGLFLVPNENANTNITGTSAGWIATRGNVTNTNGEWHFAFHARTQSEEFPIPTPTPEPTPDVPSTPEQPEIPELTSMHVQKVWNDSENRDEIRPDTITVDLMANGTVIQSVSLSEENQWAYEFTNLEKEKDYTEIVYSVKERPVNGYRASVTKESDTSYVITNTHEPEKHKVLISKQDISGDEIEGAEMEVRDENNQIVDTWISEKDQSHLIEVCTGNYSLNEINAPEGYEKAENVAFYVDTKGKVFVNNEGVDKVKMVDAYKDQEVNIYKKDQSGNGVLGAYLTVFNEENKVVDTWISADSTHVIHVQPGMYRLHEEAAPSGYKIANDISFEVNHLGEITEDDKIVHEIEMIDEKIEIVLDKMNINVVKKWNDDNDADQIRPESITVYLVKDGVKTDTFVTLSEENHWEGDFKDLEADHTYSVEEVSVEGYETKIEGNAQSGYVITNIHKLEQPEVPEVPDSPKKPEQPQSPEIPETSENPKVPETPATPTIPEITETPDTSNTVSAVPNTADHSQTTLLFSICGLSVLSLVALLRWKGK